MFEEYTSIDLGLSQENSYKLHPSVLINILNVYSRNVKQPFLMGILLGKTFPDYVSVTNVVFVSHSENEEGSLEIHLDPALKMLDYLSSIYNETRVGWFITQRTMDLKVAGLHKYFSKHLKSPTNTWAGPLCLLVDPSLETSNIQVKGYTSQPNKLYKEIFVPFQEASTIIEILPEDQATGSIPSSS